MLASIGLSEPDLLCGMHLPIEYHEDNLPPRDSLFDQRHNNCSGKHAGSLGYCRMHGYDCGDYLAIAHPLQRDIIQVITRLSGRRSSGVERMDAVRRISVCRCHAWR
jgi:L-asparaginase II